VLLVGSDLRITSSCLVPWVKIGVRLENTISREVPTCSKTESLEIRIEILGFRILRCLYLVLFDFHIRDCAFRQLGRAKSVPDYRLQIKKFPQASTLSFGQVSTENQYWEESLQTTDNSLGWSSIINKNQNRFKILKRKTVFKLQIS
jgi:hypothetical protein